MVSGLEEIMQTLKQEKLLRYRKSMVLNYTQ